MRSALPSYDEAAAQVAAYAAQLLRRARVVERVELGQAVGRVLAHPLGADRDQPPFDRSTRDGYACRAVELSRHAPLSVAGSIRAGQAPTGSLPPGTAWEIMTGAPVPEGANAVVMLEHVELVGGAIRLLPPRTLAKGENIVARGAQARQGDELLPAGSAIGPSQTALAAACGYSRLEVFARPRVAILTTGDELVPVEASPAAGQIRNSNGPMLAALVAAAGGEPLILPTASDRAEALDASLCKIADAGLLLVTGGVSAGKFDLVEPALERAGARFHFTGVRIQPGKPMVFGELPGKTTRAKRDAGRDANRDAKRAAKWEKQDAKCFFGLPGNPVSSYVTFLLFAAPVLAALAGRRDIGPRFALAQLAAEVKGNAALTRFLPACCTFGGSARALPRVAPVSWQGSGDIAALARSNCFLVLPEKTERWDAETLVHILLP